jgi:ribosomal peptide maturation radical SAM protein 1
LKPNKVILISTPWPLYTRPSIQIGTLKAFLRSQFPTLQIEAHHFYLKLAEAIGYKLYHCISERTWLAESIYAALLFPQQLKKIEPLFKREVRSCSLLQKSGLKPLVARVQKVTDTFIGGINWADVMLAGFSISLCQLTSALYFIKRIKHRSPHTVIVAGGSAFSAGSAHDLLDVFSEVDAVVIGEGELPLSRLIGHMNQFPDLSEMPPVQAIFTRKQAEPSKSSQSFWQVEALSSLPLPDYDDYFKLLDSFSPQKFFFPTLPVETSRGCWWKKNADGTKATGCAFCNLNLQWSGYRFKEPSQAAAEIDCLTTKHRTLSLAFVDNVLPKNRSGEIFGRLGKSKKDLRIFSETRATTPFSELEIMRDAGLQAVQVGIEALSTGLLKKMHKGTTTIQNLEIMKNCEALGIENLSNLILQFPGSDEQDAAETLRNLEFALPFRPLNIVNFWLGLGSLVWHNPKAYGIRAVFNHPNWTYLFPDAVCRSLRFMIQAYRGDLGRQKKLWQPVKNKVKDWQKTYRELHQSPAAAFILSFRDGRDFLIIRQRRYRAEPFTHRLVGTSRLIYLFCQHHRSLKRIRAQFPAVAEDKTIAFLNMMVDKQLMFAEKDSYLSLAVSVRRR